MTRCVLLVLLVTLGCTTDRTRRDYLLRYAATLEQPSRPAVVIPGFGVTRLYDPVLGRYVWGTAHSTLRSRYPDDLDLPPRAGDAPARDRLVPRGYAGSRGPLNVGWHLSEALRKYGAYQPGETVHPFYYDWRLTARESARDLARFLDHVSPTGRVDLITHSAGALVALTYVKLQGGGDRVDRLIMIAPPIHGSIEAFRVFMRPERFLRRTFTPDVVATWPSVYELLPEDGRFVVGPDGRSIDFDAWRFETWAKVGLGGVVSQKSIEDARRFRDELEAAPMPPGVRVTVMAGDCVPTTRRVLLRTDGSTVFYPDELRPNELSLAPVLFADGDGTVAVESVGGAADPILFCDGHQGIASDPNVHRALIRELHSQTLPR